MLPAAALAAAAAAAVAAVAAAGAAPAAHAHTVDAVEQYRLEIGWMNEPVFSGEPNGLEIFVGLLAECPGIDEPMECAMSQEFARGVGGLEGGVKVEMVADGRRIVLPLVADHDVLGKYHAFVVPTKAGYYQANLLGRIGDTQLSLSMHPPKVDEREYIEFPEPADLTVRQIIDGHTAVIDEISGLRADVDRTSAGLEEAAAGAAGGAAAAYAGLGLGAAALAAAAYWRGRR